MNAAPGSEPIRRRIAAACEYCRQKKLKCDGGRPACRNCAVHKKDCIHLELSRKPRPTKRRIQELENENRQLRLRARRLDSPPGENEALDSAASDQPPQSPVTPIRDAAPIVNESPEQSAIETPSTVQTSAKDVTAHAAAETPEDDARQYHGPTSAFFDLSSRHNGRNGAQQRSLPDYEKCAASILCAEAARQRHLEQINFTYGSLDLDGVEPTLAMHLLSIYWTRQLHCGLIVYRPAFMRDMACGGPYFSKLLLNAIFFSASKHSRHSEVRSDASDVATAGWSFRKRFTELLGDEFAKSKITTIQALLIVAVTLFTRCDERSASWLYAGNAFNMIIDLGLHVFPATPPNAKSSEEDLEIRKRVFWGAYSLDKIQCLFQGRPPILRISDANIDMLFLDNYEELEAFESTSFVDNWAHGAVPIRYTSTLHRLCGLSLIMERILTNLYGGNYSIRDSNNFYWQSRALQLDLEDWRRNQPPHIDCISHEAATHSPPLPHHLTMLALYNVLIILLRRPLIIEHHDASPTNTPRPADLAYESYSACVGAAHEIVQILQIYKKHYALSSAPYLLSYSTYIAGTILVRLLALKHNETQVCQSLVACLDALEEHSKLYKSASRTKLAIKALMQRMHVTLNIERPTEPASGAQREQSSADGCISSVPQNAGTNANPGTVAQSATEPPSGMRSEPISFTLTPNMDDPRSENQPSQQHLMGGSSSNATGVNDEAVIQSFSASLLSAFPSSRRGRDATGGPETPNDGHNQSSVYGDFASGWRYFDATPFNDFLASEFQGTLQEYSSSGIL